MTRLTGTVDGVIGVDPHRDSLAAAATDPVGGLLARTSVRADAAGYRRLLDFAQAQVPGRRCWAVEGAGSYGAGLAAFLQSQSRARGGGGPAQAAAAAQRGQERRPGRHPRRPGGAHPRLSPGAASSWRPGSAASAAGHPPQRLCGQGQRHQPAQGPDRWGARGATG
jgi:hypothetical protein